MKLKSLMMVVVMAAFAVSVSAYDPNAVPIYWLAYKGSQKINMLDQDTTKISKSPLSKINMMIPVFEAGESYVSGGQCTFIESDGKGSQYDYMLDHVYFYNFQNGKYPKSATAYGQGYNNNNIEGLNGTEENLYAVAGLAAPCKGPDGSKGSSALVTSWPSKLSGNTSTNFVNTGATSPATMNIGTWTLTYDAKASAQITSAAKAGGGITDFATASAAARVAAQSAMKLKKSVPATF